MINNKNVLHNNEYLITFFCISVKNASPDVCKVLVGNKLDAEDERVIETSRGKSVR